MVGSPVVGGDDCDDGNAAVNPGETEISDDGLDNDCNGGDSPTAIRMASLVQVDKIVVL